MRYRVFVSHAFVFLLGCSLTLFLTNIELQRELIAKEEYRAESEHLFVYLILSSPGNWERRQTIRDTWANWVHAEESKLFFAIGDKELVNSDRAKLQKEHEIHGDLILLPIVDSYSQLTLKVLKSLKHIHNEYRFKFLFKGDDDTFVSVKSLSQIARKEYLRVVRLYWGYFHGRGSIFTRGRWAETQWFLCDRYLPYAYGGGYVLSRSLVSFVADNYDKLSLYRSEDVSLASWLAGLNATRVHDIRFNTQNISRGCRDSYIVMHKQSPKEMRALFSLMESTKGQRLCDREFDTVKPYLYNWNALPSKCCNNFV